MACRRCSRTRTPALRLRLLVRSRGGTPRPPAPLRLRPLSSKSSGRRTLTNAATRAATLRSSGGSALSRKSAAPWLRDSGRPVRLNARQRGG
jgi:hypothetical protein